MKLPSPLISNDNIPRPVAYAMRHHVAPVKAFRIYGGFSAESLASEARLPYHRILAIEDGKPMTNVEAVRLSGALEVPINILRGKARK